MLDWLHRMGFKALWSCRALLAMLLALPLGGCGTSAVMPPHMSGAVPQPQMVMVSPAPPVLSTSPFLLHLPGIGGERNIDLYMTRGFKEGGFKGETQIYDWTEKDPGISSLLASRRNHEEAKKIAEIITKRFDQDPSAPIYLSCHSGGGGLAIWALEGLPDRVKINTLLMLSPALSPKYDLSPALRHVTGKVYVFSSMDDKLVLGTGCTLLGTIDGVKTDAAGRVGFEMPTTADAGQYAKLVPMPYNPEWVRLDDYGNHIGGMTHMFARTVLAPLVLSGTLPPETAEAATAIAQRSAQ